MAVPVSGRCDLNSGGPDRGLTVKSEVAVVMTTCCHPSTLAFQSFAAWEQPSWLLHEQHLGPGAPPGAREQVSAIVHACPPTKPASCICVIASSLIFRPDHPASLTLCVSGEGYRPFLAPWSDQGRALRPGPDCASNRQAGARLPASIVGL